MSNNTSERVLTEGQPGASLVINDNGTYRIEGTFTTADLAQLKNGTLKFTDKLPTHIDLRLPSGEVAKNWPLAGNGVFGFSLVSPDAYIAEMLKDQATERLNVERADKGKAVVKTSSARRRERDKKAREKMLNARRAAEQARGDLLQDFSINEAIAEHDNAHTRKVQENRALKGLNVFELIEKGAEVSLAAATTALGHQVISKSAFVKLSEPLIEVGTMDEDTYNGVIATFDEKITLVEAYITKLNAKKAAGQEVPVATAQMAA